jgi:hypothetical protein
MRDGKGRLPRFSHDDNSDRLQIPPIPMKKPDNLVTPDLIDRFFEPAHLVEMLSALASRRGREGGPGQLL